MLDASHGLKLLISDINLFILTLYFFILWQLYPLALLGLLLPDFSLSKQNILIVYLFSFYLNKPKHFFFNFNRTSSKFLFLFSFQLSFPISAGRFFFSAIAQQNFSSVLCNNILSSAGNNSHVKILDFIYFSHSAAICWRGL